MMGICFSISNNPDCIGILEVLDCLDFLEILGYIVRLSGLESDWVNKHFFLLYSAFTLKKVKRSKVNPHSDEPP